MAQESINRIVTIIASDLKRETDEPFKRLLAVRVDFWRSTLLSRSLEKHPEQAAYFRQTIWVPMVCQSELPCQGTFPLCNTMISKVPIPTPLRYGSTLFDYVGSIDGNNAFKYASVGTADIMHEGSKYSKKTLYDYIENRIVMRNKREDYLDKPIPMIRVDGVFDKPMEAYQFNCKGGNDCDFWDKPYPATGDMIQMIIQYILQVDYGKDKDKNTSAPPEIEVNPAIPRNV